MLFLLQKPPLDFRVPPQCLAIHDYLQVLLGESSLYKEIWHRWSLILSVPGSIVVSSSWKKKQRSGFGWWNSNNLNQCCFIKPLPPGGGGNNLELLIFKDIKKLTIIDILNISCEFVFRWMPQDLTDDVNIGSGDGLVLSGNKPSPEPTLTQMAKFMLPYDVTRPPWFNETLTYFSKFDKLFSSFSFKKMHLKMLSTNHQPFCLGHNLLSPGFW